MSLNNGKIYSKDNRIVTRTEPLITVEQIQARYLFGVYPKDVNGNPLPPAAYDGYLRNAISYLEHYLDISINPTCKEEFKDYYANDYFEWSYFQLNEVPVLSITSLVVTYTKNADGSDQVVLPIPAEWIRLDQDTGIVRLVPYNKFPAQLQVDAGGSFFPELFRRYNSVPSLWRFEYIYGFDQGKIPVLLNDAIGLLAAMQALSPAGHLVLGAGIAGQSLSIDGLSQSLQSTASAENSAFSATRKEFYERLYGKTPSDPTAILNILKNYYKGQGIQIL